MDQCGLSCAGVSPVNPGWEWVEYDGGVVDIGPGCIALYTHSLSYKGRREVSLSL